MGRSGRSKK